MPGPGAPDYNPEDTDAEAIRKLWGLPPLSDTPAAAAPWAGAGRAEAAKARDIYKDLAARLGGMANREVFHHLGGDAEKSSSSLKPTNPKDAAAFDKAPLHLVPASFKAYTAMALAEGAMKYGAWNWRAAGVRSSVYVSALQRHMDKWFNGEEFDPETGVPHLANACACLAVLIDSKTQMNMTDDRPPRQPALPGLVDKQTPNILVKLRGLFGEKKPKHWTINDAVRP